MRHHRTFTWTRTHDGRVFATCDARCGWTASGTDGTVHMAQRDHATPKVLERLTDAELDALAEREAWR